MEDGLSPARRKRFGDDLRQTGVSVSATVVTVNTGEVSSGEAGETTKGLAFAATMKLEEVSFLDLGFSWLLRVGSAVQVCCSVDYGFPCVNTEEVVSTERR